MTVTNWTAFKNTCETGFERTCQFIDDHQGELIVTAIIVSGIALVAFGIFIHLSVCAAIEESAAWWVDKFIMH